MKQHRSVSEHPVVDCRMTTVGMQVFNKMSRVHVTPRLSFYAVLPCVQILSTLYRSYLAVWSTWQIMRGRGIHKNPLVPKIYVQHHLSCHVESDCRLYFDVTQRNLVVLKPISICHTWEIGKHALVSHENLRLWPKPIFNDSNRIITYCYRASQTINKGICIKSRVCSSSSSPDVRALAPLHLSQLD